MPKDWMAQKNNLKKYYITEDRPLEEVRQILKDRYGFDASIRSYRMKIDEWNLRKYKSRKDANSQGRSAHPRTKSKGRIATPEVISLPPTTQTESTRFTSSADNQQNNWNVDESPAVHNPLTRNQHHSTLPPNVMAENGDDPWVDLFRSSTQSINQNLPQVLINLAKRNIDHNIIDEQSSQAFRHATPSNPETQDQLYHFDLMMKNWKDGNGVRDYVDTVLPMPSSKVTTFQTMEAGKVNLFDLICKKVNKAEQVPLIKDFLRIFSESNPHEPTAQYICWRSALIEAHRTRFKRALGLLKLNGCMSREAADLVFCATFLLVGERLIDAYRTRFDMGDSLGSAISNSTFKHVQRYSESPEYFRDREQYAAMLKDFRLRCINHWEE